MSNIHTTVQNTLDALVASGQERGVQAVFYLRGELVADCFAGEVDAQSGGKVTGETLFPVFSTTKAMVATVVHRLVERGLFGYETPIAQLWPEFGARRKSGILVRHALNHTAGLARVPTGIDAAQLLGWDSLCAAIADSSPHHAPGELAQYHAITFGTILGEVARRATGRSFPELLRDEIAVPLGLHTMWAGVPADVEHLIARLEEPNAPQPAPSDEPEAIPFWLFPLGEWMNRSDVRRACVPASNGVMNARAIARHYASLLPGGVDGVELLSPGRVECALQRQTPRGADEPSPFGLGYMFGAHGSFGHGGYGGSTGLANREEGWAFGFTRNRLSDAPSAELVLCDFRDAMRS